MTKGSDFDMRLIKLMILTSDMQGMVWGEPERGSAQNGIWKCDGDDSSHDSISSDSIASVYGTKSC